jgi:hypothetical protein
MYKNTYNIKEVYVCVCVGWVNGLLLGCGGLALKKSIFPTPMKKNRLSNSQHHIIPSLPSHSNASRTQPAPHSSTPFSASMLWILFKRLRESTASAGPVGVEPPTKPYVGKRKKKKEKSERC